MRIIAKTNSKQEYDFEKIIYLKIEKSITVPADSLNVKISVDERVKELCEVKCVHEGKTIFEGFVDEQILSFSKDGLVLTIKARNRVCKLLDNEALPREYNKPSFSDIFNIHCKKYGFAGHEIDAQCPSSFSVTKGMSEWDVVEKFCTQVIGKMVFVEDEKFFVDVGTNDNYTISNDESFAIRFARATVDVKRYGVISRIDYKIKDSDSYDYMIENKYATQKGIDTKRFVNLTGFADWRNKAILKQRLINSIKDSFKITVDIPQIYNFKIGERINFIDEKIGNYNNLIINEYSIVLKGGEYYTRVVGMPEINYSEGALNYGMVSE